MKAGAVLLMPRRRPPRRAPTQPTPPVTTGAVIVLTLENPNLPEASGRCETAGAASAVCRRREPRAARPTTVALNQETYNAMSALAEGTAVVVEAEVKPGPKTLTWNAVGRLTGSDTVSAAEVILLSAHLDHVGSHRLQNAAPGRHDLQWR